MGFALCPDNGPPRLWRFVDDDILTAGRIAAMLDAEQNLLIVNRPVFDTMTEQDQHITLRTHARFVYASGARAIHQDT